MRYGKDYNARMLTEFQQQIATELIARELCGPSHHNAWGSYIDTDHPELQEAARRILYQPDNMGGRYLSIRADAIHASFGIARLVKPLVDALKPFAEYGAMNRKFPRGGQITHGSSMAKKQLTMGNCYDAADALKVIEP